MKIIKSPSMVARLRSIFFTLFNRLENNNNANFHSNGEEEFLNILFPLFNQKVILFDIGANVGGYSEILLEQCRKQSLEYSLHIFEPTKSCFEILKNKFNSDPNIHLNNVGVSDNQRESEIFYDAEKSGFASLYKRDEALMNVQMNKSETISLIRLDEYISQNDIQWIDFLKIDIEGHELVAFCGLGKYLHSDFIKAIQFEYGGSNLDSGTTLRQLYNELEDAGFSIFKIMKKTIEQRTYRLSMENYQYANYVALSGKFFPSL